MKDLPINQIIHGDCLEVMKELPDKSIDMILCDLPYGTTACEWDAVIPFEPLWEQYERIIKDNGAIVLFGSEPFTSLLITSNLKLFKYNWIWKKTKATGFFDCKKRPLNDYETISVFYKKQPVYNPQMIKAEKIYKRGYVKRKKSDCYGEEKDFVQKETGLRYPKRIIEFGNANTRGIIHPAQKPVALCEYLIKTYTLPGEVVLDNCIGSGTTAIACINTGRDFIGIEIEEEYVKIAKKRIEACKKQNQMRLFPLSKSEKTSKKYKGLFE
jgi:DNA modification methylase